MSDAGSAKPGDERGESDVLRAKYHDYCSAQLARLLLYLSPDQIYLLAQTTTGPEAAQLEDLTYARMVEMATSWLADRIPLPPFEVWLEDYRAHPGRYEEDLMGLWETDLKATPESH